MGIIIILSVILVGLIVVIIENTDSVIENKLKKLKIKRKELEQKINDCEYSKIRKKYEEEIIELKNELKLVYSDFNRVQSSILKNEEACVNGELTDYGKTKLENLNKTRIKTAKELKSKLEIREKALNSLKVGEAEYIKIDKKLEKIEDKIVTLKENSYNNEIILTVSGIFTSIVLVAILVLGIVAGVTHSQEDYKYNEMLYERKVIVKTLDRGGNNTVQFENQEYIIERVNEFNAEILKSREFGDNFWVGWFIYDKIADIDLIE